MNKKEMKDLLSLIVDKALLFNKNANEVAEEILLNFTVERRDNFVEAHKKVEKCPECGGNGWKPGYRCYSCDNTGIESFPKDCQHFVGGEQTKNIPQTITCEMCGDVADVGWKFRWRTCKCANSKKSERVEKLLELVWSDIMAYNTPRNWMEMEEKINYLLDKIK
jgi:hypothetical protein